MTTTVEGIGERARLEYIHDFAEDVAAVDDLVSHIKGSSDNWFRARAIRLWPVAIEKTLAEYDGTGVTKIQIDTAKEILNTGTVDGTRIDVEPVSAKVQGWRESSPDLVMKPIDAVTAYNQRLFYAHLALGAPQEFDALYENEIFAFHGTKGITLPSILAHGAILSHKLLHQNDIPIGTGDADTAAIRREYVSFSGTSERTAITHSQKHLTIENKTLFDDYPGYELRGEELKAFRAFVRQCVSSGNKFMQLADSSRFGILMGISKPALWMSGIDPQLGERTSIETPFPEYTFMSEVPVTYTPVIAAPTHRKDIERYVAKKGYDMTVISSKAIERAQDMMRRPI